MPICETCGKDKEDALRRAFVGEILKTRHMDHDPILCALCCSKWPDREWMAAQAND